MSFHSSLVIVTSRWWRRIAFQPRATKSRTARSACSLERKFALKQRLPPTKRRGVFFASFSKTKCPSGETRAKPSRPAGASRGTTFEKSRIEPGFTSFVHGKTTHLSPAAIVRGGGGSPRSTRPAGRPSESANAPERSNSTVELVAFFASGKSIRSSKRSSLSLRPSHRTGEPFATARRNVLPPSFETTSIAPLSPTPIHSSR